MGGSLTRVLTVTPKGKRWPKPEPTQTVFFAGEKGN